MGGGLGRMVSILNLPKLGASVAIVGIELALDAVHLRSLTRDGRSPYSLNNTPVVMTCRRAFLYNADAEWRAS
jgi:hypothetical protein